MPGEQTLVRPRSAGPIGAQAARNRGHLAGNEPVSPRQARALDAPLFPLS